ncbi:MAG TPA: hypothetical protein DCR15_15165 [Arthrobacter bacterium]|nr:hypothetical protein [Arthrobacter sp.]
MKPIICPCGTEKDLVRGYATCCHCDDVCPDRGGCYLCGAYSAATNKRISGEYAAERNTKANG